MQLKISSRPNKFVIHEIPFTLYYLRLLQFLFIGVKICAWSKRIKSQRILLHNIIYSRKIFTI